MLNDLVCWLAKAESAVRTASAAELDTDLQALTVSALFSVFANALCCTDVALKIMVD